MTKEEILEYCKDNNLCARLSGENNIIIFDDKYREKTQDISRNGPVIKYNIATGIIKVYKCRENISQLTNDVDIQFRFNDITNNLGMFLKYIIKKANMLYKKYNYCYDGFFNNKYELYNDSIFTDSKYHSYQAIISNKTKQQIIFEENNQTLMVLNARKYPDLFNENSFAEFVEESFEFCKENKCSFKNYAEKIVFNILQLKLKVGTYIKKKSQSKPFYIIFDKDGKTAFTYNSETINCIRVVGNKPLFIKSNIKKLINSRAELRRFIKNNERYIEDMIGYNINQYYKKKKQEEEKIKQCMQAVQRLNIVSKER